MPTPFMHLNAAHRWLQEAPAEAQAAIMSHLGAFLLGNVAPDARVSTGLSREETHFFEYAAKIEPPAKDAMFEAHPTLETAVGEQRAFVAGYIAHLAMDVVWAESMLYPNFYKKDWLTPAMRFVHLHVLLLQLDERDYGQWPDTFAPALANAQPDHWLPFLGDADLIEWRNIIADQILPGKHSKSIEVLGTRVSVGEAGLREILADEARIQDELWANVPQGLVESVEQQMFAAMRRDLLNYLME